MILVVVAVPLHGISMPGNDSLNARNRITYLEQTRRYYDDKSDTTFLISISQSDEYLQSARIRYLIYNTLSDRSKWMNNYSLMPHYIRDSLGGRYEHSYFVKEFSHFVCESRMPWNFEKMPYSKNEKVSTVPGYGSIHGNFTYEYFYRDIVDTPFSIHNLQQHSESMYFDTYFKRLIPVRVIIRARQANTAYYKNYFDVSLQMNTGIQTTSIKNRLADQYKQQLDAEYKQAITSTQLASVSGRAQEINDWLQSTKTKQELINEMEPVKQELAKYDLMEENLRSVAADSISDSRYLKSKLFGNNKEDYDKLLTIPDNASLNGNEGREYISKLLQLVEYKKLLSRNKLESAGPLAREYAEKSRLYDSLSQMIDTLERSYQSKKAEINDKVAAYKQQLQGANSFSELKEVAKRGDWNSLTRFDKLSLGIKKLTVGRTALNYTDLTANNLSLTGLNIEYNQRFYTAVAAGIIDYQFRDFSLQPTMKYPRQYLFLARAGWGDINRKAVILTAFRGAKNLYQSVQNSSASNAAFHSTQIFGYSLLLKYRINRFTDASVEVAKSSGLYIARSTQPQKLGSAFQFSDRNNEAVLLKAAFSYPKSHTQIDASWRLIGLNFQSFGLFNQGNKQKSWNIRARQYVWRRRLSLLAQLRTMDFSNPLVQPDFHSNTLLTTYQATLNVKKWPVVSVSYMPVMQLSKGANGLLNESMFYTYNATALYNYTCLRKSMNTSIFYTRYNNRSGTNNYPNNFSSSASLSQTVLFGSLSSQTSFQLIKQAVCDWYTVREEFDVRIGKSGNCNFSLSNHQLSTGYKSWGGSLGVRASIKKIGVLQLQFDRNYIANNENTLSPYTWGRAVFSTMF